MADLSSKIMLYKKRLEKENDYGKILRDLHKLKSLHMTLELLQETGIGKTVNNFRKWEGEVADESKSLVRTWKQLVASHGESNHRHSTNSVEPKKKEFKKESYGRSSDDSSSGYRTSSSKTSSTKHSLNSERGNSYNNSYSDEYIDDDNHYQYSDDERDSKRSSKKFKADNGSSDGESVHHKYHNGFDNNSDKLKKKKGSEKKKNKKLVSTEEGFDSSITSFEACLGLNDYKGLKKKKHSSPVQSPAKTSARCSSHSGSSFGSNTSDFYHNGDKGKKVKTEVHKAKIEVHKPMPKLLDDSDWRNSEPLKINSNEYDVELTLPSIQPNYKPLRMGMPVSPPVKKKSFSGHEGNLLISSKHCRTQVFSGRKAQGTNEMLSLQDICVRVLQENVDAIDYTGGIPYFLLKPILERCNPVQLGNLENFNSYLTEDTDELWRLHCLRQFRNHSPDEAESWRELYDRLTRERDKKFARLTKSISNSIATATPIRQAKLADDTFLKPPRNVQRAQAKYGTAGPNHGMPIMPGKNVKNGNKTVIKNTGSSSSGSGSSSSVKEPKEPKEVKVVKKVAPLMKKTLSLMKNRFKR